MADTKSLLDALLDTPVRMVFWTCPNDCDGMVKWDFSTEPYIATCETCGRTSASDTAPGRLKHNEHCIDRRQ